MTRQPHPKLIRLSTARGRVRVRVSLGDGPVCPTDPKHGPTYVLPSRVTFCSHAQHSREGSRSTWPPEPPESIGRLSEVAS